MNVDLTGEVVPCCFWSGYANSGKPLGNTNTQTLDEIWNGEAYQELRRTNASGNLAAGHPCHQCLGWKWGGETYPKFSWPVSFEQETGHCFTSILSQKFLDAVAATDEVAELHENGAPLPHSDAVHDDIRQLGEGRYSLWGNTLYFSSTDNSDARTNGRDYELRCGPHSYRLANFKPETTSGRNMALAHEEYEAGATVMQAKPTMISFVATADCNIDCPACSQNTVRLLKVQHRGRTEVDLVGLVPYLTQLIWHGGEPYLIQRFREFVDGFETADNPNLTFGFTSNGTLLNADELAKLEKFPRINASVSIDSFQRETFDVIRAGANFDTVMANVLRAVQRYEAPDFLMHVGMIITKGNMSELGSNLRFAMEHDIGLNLSPVVVYPVPEQIDVFEDFETQTRGWRDAISEAKAVIEEARARTALSLLRIDPAGHVRAIEEIVERAAQRYSETFDIVVSIADPAHHLADMRRPGIVVAFESDTSNPMAYVTLDRGPGEYVLRLPIRELAGDQQLNWYLLHDMYEPMGVADMEPFVNEQGAPVALASWRSMPGSLFVEIPSFGAVMRPRNATLANRGLPTPDGLHVVDPLDMLEAYQALQWQEYSGASAAGPLMRMNRTDHSVFRDRLWNQRYGAFRSLS
jgi:MoaA/NifB/PqqE/SkfB family radical SAM enzyme